MRGALIPLVAVVLLASAGVSRAEYPIYDCAEYADEDQITPVPKPTIPHTSLPAEVPAS